MASDARVCLPAVYPRWANNVRNNLSGVSLVLRAITQLRKMDLFTLFDLHAARPFASQRAADHRQH